LQPRALRGGQGQNNATAKGFELTQPFLKNFGENEKKKKTFLKEKREDKKSLY
jgi:hypothetical protein